MTKFLKNIGFGILVLIISIAIYWFLFMDRAAKQDALTYALKLLGDNFLELIPAGEGRNSVQALYNNFLEQAKARQVPPENIEYVTANILNLSNLGKTITPEEAETILNYSLSDPLIINTDKLDSTDRMIIASDTPIVVTATEPPIVIPQQKWDELALKIQTMHDFNREMKKAAKDLAEEHQELHKHIRFSADSILRIEIDSEFKNRIHKAKFERLSQEMTKMEQDKILLRKQNLNDNFSLKMKIIDKQMDSIKMEIKKGNLSVPKKFSVLKSLKKIQGLEELGCYPAINVDSLNVIITKEINANIKK